jgi:hypothetical protein
MRILPARRAVAGRRPEPRVARPERAPIPWVRLTAAVGLVATSALLYWMTNNATFTVDASSVPVTGARFTPTARILAAMGLVPGTHPNVFRLRTDTMEAAAEQLPTVRRASVVATLPDRLFVTITERTPMITWHTAGGSFLVDVEGVLFAPASEATAAELGTGATGSALPSVEDDRPADSSLVLGDRLDPLDLAAARLLGALKPADLLSHSPSLHLSVDVIDGWVLQAPGKWRAIFGHYTPQLRPPDGIAVQVQCLRSLLASREDAIGEVTLATGTDPCGTYRPARPARSHAGGSGAGAGADAGATPAGDAATAAPGRGAQRGTPRPTPPRTPHP